MNRAASKHLVIAAAVTLFSACGFEDFDFENGGGSGGGSGGESRPSPSASSKGSISTRQEAEELFSALKSMAAAVDGKVAKNFSSPVTISGASGKVTVSGTKTASSTSSSSSTSTTRTSNLTMVFSSYRSGDLTISGTLKWYDHYYSRTACSSTTCASASDHSESMSGSSLQVTYTPSSGEKVTDTVTVSANSGKDSSRWSVSVTTKAGQKFTFSAY